MYQTLLDEHRTLQTSYDDAVQEKDEAKARLREARNEVDNRRNEKADGMMRAEIDRLRAELYDILCSVIMCSIFAGRRAKTTLLWQNPSWTRTQYSLQS